MQCFTSWSLKSIGSWSFCGSLKARARWNLMRNIYVTHVYINRTERHKPCSDHRYLDATYVAKEGLKAMDWKGLQPPPLQWSTNWAIGPIGSCSLCENKIIHGRFKSMCNINESHTFEPWSEAQRSRQTLCFTTRDFHRILYIVSDQLKRSVKGNFHFFKNKNNNNNNNNKNLLILTTNYQAWMLTLCKDSHQKMLKAVWK